MKKTLLAIMLAAVGVAGAQAKTDLNELHQELEIMSNILKTALRQNNDREGIRFRDVDSTYLYGQGVVFDISTSNSGWNFSFDFGEILTDINVPVAPTAPVVSVGKDWEFVIDDMELDEVIANAMEEAQDAMRELRERSRELREREREFSWEEREYERRQRDLEFELRNADGERKKELEERLKEMRGELAELQKKRQEVNKYAEELEQKRKEQLEQNKEAKVRKQKQFLANFEASVGDVLCKYGAGVKSLPKDEHVSFVLSGFADNNGREGRRDRVYVFSNDDIQSCVRDKIDVNKLLGEAQAYVF